MHITRPGAVNGLTPWGSVVTEFLSLKEVVVLNTGAPTYLGSQNRCFFCLDLAICSSAPFTYFFSCNVVDNLSGSHHFQVYLTPLEVLPRLTCCPPRWKNSSADYGLFYSSIPSSLDLSQAVSVDDSNVLIASTIPETAGLSIPHTSSYLPRRPKPWGTVSVANLESVKTVLGKDCAKVRYIKNKGKRDPSAPMH